MPVLRKHYMPMPRPEPRSLGRLAGIGRSWVTDEKKVERAQRLTGGAHLNLNDAPVALISFEAVRATLKPDETPDTDLLAGLSLAQWLNQKQPEAIATYQQLIGTGRAQEEPTDWADPKTITDLTWPDAETIPLEALRAATLAKHPELAPKPDPALKPKIEN